MKPRETLARVLSTIFPWSYVEALCAHPVVWVVLFFSMGIKGMVNQIEQPFARSLVSCDVPLDPDVYSGSVWCGDRFRVIQEGMYISGLGQGQEHFAMLCSLTFVIIITGIWGVKISLLLGLVGVTVSVFLFIVACSTPSMARTLFTAGQGLQGLYPIEYLQGLLMLQIGMLPGSNGQANFQVMGYLGLVSNIVWNLLLGSFVQLLELTNYKPIWTAVFALDVSIVLLVALAFPEMKPLDAEKYRDLGPFRKVYREVTSYLDLAFDWRARRYLIHKVFENLTYPWESVMTGGMCLAWHGWGQGALTWIFFWPQIMGLFTFNLWQLVEQRFGNYSSFVWYVRGTFSLRALTTFLMVWTPLPSVTVTYANVLFSGFMGKRGFVDSRFVEPEMMQKFQSAQWVMGYFMSMWVAPFYATLFNANAATFWERLQPMLWYFAALVGNFVALFWGIWDLDGVEGCGVSLRVLDEGGHKATYLWSLISAPDGVVTAERWALYELEPILGVPWAHTGADHTHGAIWEHGHFMGIIGSLNSTPKAGQEALRKLDLAILKASSVHSAFKEEQARAALHQLGQASEGREPAPAGEPASSLLQAARPAEEGKKDA